MTSALSLLPMRRGKLLVATVGILGLAGCATFSDDGGFGRVEQTTRERLDKDVQWARSDAERSTLQARVGELLANPLTADDAIQLALYNNRGLQAAFFDLGISEAELVQAGRLPNPHFSMLRASKPENGIREYKIEQALTFNIFALITMPLWSTFAAKRVLGLPRNVTPCAVIPMGWPIGRYGPTTRGPVGQFVSLDRYGNRAFL